LLQERGLGHATARHYVDAVRPFLSGRLSPDGLALDWTVAGTQIRQSDGSAAETILQNTADERNVIDNRSRSQAARFPQVLLVGLGAALRGLSIVAALRAWLAERGGQATDTVFTTHTGRTLSRDALERRLATHVATAVRVCPSLRDKKITLHVLRHTVPFRTMSGNRDRQRI
jgi:hypothetical protein